MTAGHRGRVRILWWVAGLLAIMLLGGCGGDAGPDAEETASSQTSEGDASGTTGGPGTSPTPDISVAETIVELTITKGVPSTDLGQVAVPLGNTVRLFITADAPDEVHVHGYDLTLDLAAGVPGELTFVADVPGIFEVELHESEQLLCELRVE